jgi:hypothetical protein
MTMYFDRGFEASALETSSRDAAEIAWQLRLSGEPFGGFFVDRGGATLAWPSADVDFATIETDALSSLPGRLDIGTVRLPPGGDDGPWTAAWIVTADGGSQRYLLQNGDDFTAYRRLMAEPGRVTFARFDVAYPPDFEPLLYSFTAQRVARDTRPGSMGLRLTDGRAWTREPLVDWVLQQHTGDRQAFAALDYAGVLANVLGKLIDQSYSSA